MPRNFAGASDFHMYGPVNASTLVPYWVGFIASYFAANDFGTGTVSGIESAPSNSSVVGIVRWKTIVVALGVWMPEIGPPVAFAAPTMSPKYGAKYAFPTFGFAPRSIA